MKILVLQLARFGDIYQSWPALRALRRKWPNAEITLMVREKFAAATKGLEEVDRVIRLDTAHILAPVIFQSNGIEGALAEIDKLLKDAADEYDRVINLSFSPLSSFIAQALMSPHSIVTGYNRYSDGSLSIPDDASAYFYAQAGTDRWSRVHLTDLFALVAGIEELLPEDWRPPVLASVQVPNTPYVVLQPGASDPKKTLQPKQWMEIVQTLIDETDLSVVIVGSREEAPRYCWPDDVRVTNLMGSTQLHEVMTFLRHSIGFIGPDSVGLHMCALTATPVFNISIGPVRFWETGPRSLGSRVFKIDSHRDFSLIEFWREFRLFQQQEKSEKAFEVILSSGVVYQGPTLEDDLDFEWRLTQALYMHSDFPRAEDRILVMAFHRMAELCELGLEQLEFVKNEASRPISLSILNEIDHLLEKVCELDPRVRPVAQWFLTQKLRLGPATFEEVRQATIRCFEDLHTVTQVYALPIDWNENLPRKDLTWKP